MLCRLYYLMCDRCGALSSDGEDSAETARRLTRLAHWTRVPGIRPSDQTGYERVDGRDYCPRCADEDA